MTLHAYQGYLMISDIAHARNMAHTAGVDWTRGMMETTPNKTLERPAHCMRAAIGEPPTRPSAAWRISRDDRNWNVSRGGEGGRTDDGVRVTVNDCYGASARIERRQH